MTDRLQRVSSEQVLSRWSEVTSGVPQGSVLGPVLFALCIDSLSPICANSACFKYADDVTFLHFIRKDSDDVLQSEWNNLEKWSRDVGLFLNLDKCCVMNCVTKKSLVMKPLTTLNSVTIRTVNTVRLLGVLFSSNLTWNDHFSLVTKKCFKRFFILRNLRNAKCPSFILHRCYVAFIRSVMLYAFPCLCNAPKYLMAKFLCVERRASRFFPGYDFMNFTSAAD
ncbi:MAG: reverse transcriptase domain-containing protein, partial [Pseudomonadota bacterium]